MGGDTVFGRSFGINWFWAVVVCGYHVVWSVLVPIAVVECLFPQRIRSAWLSIRGSALVAVLFGFGAAVLALISYLRSDYRLAPGTRHHHAAAGSGLGVGCDPVCRRAQRRTATPAGFSTPSVGRRLDWPTRRHRLVRAAPHRLHRQWCLVPCLDRNRADARCRGSSAPCPLDQIRLDAANTGWRCASEPCCRRRCSGCSSSPRTTGRRTSPSSSPCWSLFRPRTNTSSISRADRRFEPRLWV